MTISCDVLDSLGIEQVFNRNVLHGLHAMLYCLYPALESHLVSLNLGSSVLFAL